MNNFLDEKGYLVRAKVKGKEDDYSPTLSLDEAVDWYLKKVSEVVYDVDEVVRTGLAEFDEYKFVLREKNGEIKAEIEVYS